MKMWGSQKCAWLLGFILNLLLISAPCLAHTDQLKDELTGQSWTDLHSRVELILNKFGPAIPLPPVGFISRTNEAILRVAVTQELWVAVMGTNLSFFKEKIYCPETHREDMCPDFPAEQITSKNRGLNDSDEELIARLNLIFKMAQKQIKFRRSTRAEWLYADTAGGKERKLDKHAYLAPNDPKNLLGYTPYLHRLDLSLDTPSGEPQPRSVRENKPNSLGFRRAGVGEWTAETDYGLRTIVGGSWNLPFLDNLSDSARKSTQDTPSNEVGSARLVMTILETD